MGSPLRAHQVCGVEVDPLEGIRLDGDTDVCASRAAHSHLRRGPCPPPASLGGWYAVVSAPAASMPAGHPLSLGSQKRGGVRQQEELEAWTAAPRRLCVSKQTLPAAVVGRRSPGRLRLLLGPAAAPHTRRAQRCPPGARAALS
eukprot:3169480-Prymnesium_polylepis.1